MGGGEGEYSCILAPDKRDIQKDDMGEYQETCHEENLCGFPFAFFLLSQKHTSRESCHCAKGVGWRGLYEKTDLRKKATNPSLLHAQGIRCTPPPRPTPFTFMQKVPSQFTYISTRPPAPTAR
jgi:hypothetical protein